MQFHKQTIGRGGLQIVAKLVIQVMTCRGVHTDSNLQRQSDWKSFIFNESWQFEAHACVGNVKDLSRVQLYANEKRCNVATTNGSAESEACVICPLIQHCSQVKMANRVQNLSTTSD